MLAPMVGFLDGRTTLRFPQENLPQCFKSITICSHSIFHQFCLSVSFHAANFWHPLTMNKAPPPNQAPPWLLLIVHCTSGSTAPSPHSKGGTEQQESCFQAMRQHCKQHHDSLQPHASQVPQTSPRCSSPSSPKWWQLPSWWIG